MNRPFKRVVACGDMHCGHRVGLTPPKHQSQRCGGNYFEIQKECWDFFESNIKALQPIDILIHNGDAIDGKGERAGGTDLIVHDRTKQAKMASEIIKFIAPRHAVLTYGTPYHTGQKDDFERTVVDLLEDSPIDATIGGQEWITVNGTTFDIKHKVGSSSVPYGRATAASKEHVWNIMWADIGEQPRASVILRSHVHYFIFSGGPYYLAMTLPALQAQGSKFGQRQCSGLVDFGFVVFDCYEDGSFEWNPYVLRAESHKQEARIL